MNTDISDWSGAAAGVEAGAIAAVNADADVDIEVNPYADIDTALVIDTHVCRSRCRSIDMAIY